jgi:hypothetical protein
MSTERKHEADAALMSDWYGNARLVTGGFAAACVESVKNAEEVWGRMHPVSRPKVDLEPRTVALLRDMYTRGRSIRAAAVETRLELWQIRAATPGCEW